MDEIRTWNEPDYPEGNWIDQERWKNTGMDEVFQYAKENSAPLQSFEDITESYSAIYTVNDVGTERIIPIFNSEDIETVGGVFDSNPGYTQRFTPWETEFSGTEIEEEIDRIGAEVTELEPQHVRSIERVTEDRVTKLYSTIAGLSDYIGI